MATEITYTRAGGTGDPPESESISVHADGTFDAVRTVAPRAAGRLAGTLPDEMLGDLRRAADAAAAAPAPDAQLMPGAPRETISLSTRDGGPVDVARSSGAPWSDLRAALVAALDAAVDHPADALRVVVDAAAPAVRIEAIGAAVVDGEVSLVAVRWSGSWEEMGRAELAVPAGGAPTGLDPSVAPAAGERLQVTATALLRTDPAARPVKVAVTAEAPGS